MTHKITLNGMKLSCLNGIPTGLKWALYSLTSLIKHPCICSLGLFLVKWHLISHNPSHDVKLNTYRNLLDYFLEE